MKGRYDLIEIYNGLFDEKRVIAVTDDLMQAVNFIEKMQYFVNENPCYSYDFEKKEDKIDEIADFFPGESFLDIGKIIECKNYKEFLQKK